MRPSQRNAGERGRRSAQMFSQDREFCCNFTYLMVLGKINHKSGEKQHIPACGLKDLSTFFRSEMESGAPRSECNKSSKSRPLAEACPRDSAQDILFSRATPHRSSDLGRDAPRRRPPSSHSLFLLFTGSSCRDSASHQLPAESHSSYLFS